MNPVSEFIRINLPLFGFLLLISFSSSAYTGKKRTLEGETAKSIGGASTVADRSASKGFLATLTNAGQAIVFNDLPSAGKLADFG